MAWQGPAPQTLSAWLSAMQYGSMRDALEEGLSAGPLAGQAGFLICRAWHEMAMQPLAGKQLGVLK